MKPSAYSSAFQIKDNKLNISGVPVDEIVKKYGSPLYVYDANTIKLKFQALRDALPNSIEIFYAMKPNPTKAIVELLQAEGCGLEIASIGELKVCQAINADPNNIVFAGPAKTDDELKAAIEAGIRVIHVESVNELHRIDIIGRQLDRKVAVGLRINTEFQINASVLQMGGASQKFGIDENQMKNAIKTALDLPNIELVGIHVYSATGILNTDEFLLNVRKSLEVAKSANELFTVKSIDFGGGYGIPYDSGEQLDVNKLGASLEDIIDEFPFITNNDTRLITEPGRYLVAESGIYLTTVLDRKESYDTTQLVCDGGIHQFLRSTLIGSQHPIHNLTRISEENSIFQVGGPLCTPLDYLDQNCKLPADTDLGDVLGVFLAGAYGYTASMQLFLSHDLPAEVLINNGVTQLIRKPLTIESLLKDQPRLGEMS